MRLLFALLLLAAAACAQSPPWVDVSGEWKIANGDDPRFASPDFDDSGWALIRLPADLFDQKAFSVNRYCWLRRVVDLPPDSAGQRLSLTVGKLTENYRIFINGELVGGPGDFTAAASRIARPRTFDLPPLRHGRAVIAIRVWSHTVTGPRSWRGRADSGPYVITGLVNAPRSAGSDYILRIREAGAVDLVSSVFLLGLSIIILLVWLRQRRPELLWLAVFDAVVAYRWLQTVYLVSETAAPWADYFLAGPWIRVLFLSFLLAAVGVRVRAWEAALWIFTLTTYFYFQPLRAAHTIILHGFAAGVLLWAAFRRSGLGVTLAASAAVLAGGVWVDAFTNVLGGMHQRTLFFGSYRFEFQPILATLFSLTIVLDLTRRLLADSAEKQRMTGELEAARTIQSLLLDHEHVQAGAYAVDAAYRPAQEVGGDFYQILPSVDGSVLVVVGDVSGKGLKAAMIVSMLTGAVRAHSTLPPAALLAEMNRVLGIRTGGFVTCLAMRFEPCGAFVIANAGHPGAYRDGAEVEVGNGLPLGIVEDADYTESRIELPGADTVTIVTDGVIEAANEAGALFGFDRTRGISTQSAKEIAKAAAAWGQNDDITVVTVRRNRSLNSAASPE